MCVCMCECVLCKWPERKIVFKWISMQRSVKHFTPRRRGEAGNRSSLQERGGNRSRLQQRGVPEYAQKDMRRLQLLDERYLLIPDAIKHFINESFWIVSAWFHSHKVRGQSQNQISCIYMMHPKWQEPIDVYAPRVNEPERTWPAFSSP